jgi:hypothetical protein
VKLFSADGIRNLARFLGHAFADTDLLVDDRLLFNFDPLLGDRNALRRSGWAPNARPLVRTAPVWKIMRRRGIV